MKTNHDEEIIIEPGLSLADLRREEKAAHERNEGCDRELPNMSPDAIRERARERIAAEKLHAIKFGNKSDAVIVACIRAAMAEYACVCAAARAVKGS